jgi:hypothetical protein
MLPSEKATFEEAVPSFEELPLINIGITLTDSGPP